MKIPRVIAFIILLTALPGGAQESQPAPPTRRIVHAGGADAQEPTSILSTNYQVTIVGSLGKTDPIDVTLRGSSRVFIVTLVEPICQIEVKVKDDAESLSVDYSIIAQLAVKTGENSIQFRDARVVGSFLATLGQPFPILQSGDSKLTIQVDEVSGKK